jgi:hypothetical protein
MGQNGNVREWFESAFDGVNNLTNETRGYRGGSWDSDELRFRSSFRVNDIPSDQFSVVGFRVASIPEPSSILLTIILLGSALLLGRRRTPRKAR